MSAEETHAPAEARVARFGLFEVDLQTAELRRGGRRLRRLPPQPFDVLRALLARPGEVVSREGLRRRLWGERVFVDFERSLNFCIRRLRLGLDDDARRPRFVETIPTRGYRFIAPVTFDGEASSGRASARVRLSLAAGAARTALLAGETASALAALAEIQRYLETEAPSGAHRPGRA
jgi:DNA-binding winged helix-turn-helix (wHTH) protein